MGGTERVAQHLEYYFSLWKYHNKTVSCPQCYLHVSKGTVAPLFLLECLLVGRWVVPAECDGEMDWVFPPARKSDWWLTVPSTTAKSVHSPCTECCYQCYGFLPHRGSQGFFYTWKSCMASLPFTGPSRFWLNAFLFTLAEGIQNSDPQLCNQ